MLDATLARVPAKSTPSPPALQLPSGGTYSALYVAVDSYTDPPSNPSGRLLTPCTRGAYAAPAQRGLGSGVRVGHDREHIRRSDFFGIDESNSLSWGDLFRGNFDTHLFDRETKSGTTRRRSRK
jgi:hypothetical protein